MINTSLSTRLRELLIDGNCYNPATIFNPLSARLAGDVGFKLGIIPGKIVALDYLSEPDLMLLTLSELTDTVRRIAKNTEIPLIVDADNGYGNALNVKRTVENLEDAGASGISIEDTDLPIKFGALKKSDFLNIKEASKKIKIAVDSRKYTSTCIIARTSCYSYTGFQDMIERGKAYESEGADAIFYVNIDTRDDIYEISNHHKVPIILGNNSTEMPPDELADLGISISLPGHKAYFIAMQAYKDAMQRLFETGNFGDYNIDMDKLGELSNEDIYSNLIDKYMKG
ncbi:MAG: isocitrate lyase/phosphoenolpyruvate mutase family protein [Pseudomonadota bacterium]|nr:isocitrate lyase/phosphoenolpyruvate mutase family protein [Pseudomonadota bacterium]